MLQLSFKLIFCKSSVTPRHQMPVLGVTSRTVLSTDVFYPIAITAGNFYAIISTLHFHKWIILFEQILLCSTNIILNRRNNCK